MSENEEGEQGWVSNLRLLTEGAATCRFPAIAPMVCTGQKSPSPGAVPTRSDWGFSATGCA